MRSFRLAEDLQYVINPAAGLTVQDFKVALIVEGNEVEPFGGEYTLEGSVVQPDGSFNYLYRTEYQDAACIKNTIFTTEALGGTGDLSQEFVYKTAYLKVMLNLRPVAATATQQNVLFVARYPVTTSAVASYASLPVASCGVLSQATPAAIDAVCQGTKYKQAIVLTRPAGKGKAAVAGSVPSQGTVLQAFPNPATGSVRLSYQVAQPGRVRLILSDALGREVRTVVDQSQSPAGTFEVTAGLTGLRAGIYYCTLHTATQHKVERIVVAE
ncbi:T9SS type A sorting domain-containing protein [Hymenobacter humi]|uniref:T9SS type A sorting domain-containing protein n=1 Tax=Hymenobacter humi TaxID=1411620 RepID=A0ABW2UDU0_9BACT